jgi:RNA polymerase sigma-70 factor (ECF subfamily)
VEPRSHRPSTPATDRELVERALGGDSDAFNALVTRHHPRVFRVVRGVLGDFHRSEDVCQDVFATLYRKLQSFRHEAQLSTWLYRVAVNAALKARHRHRRTELKPLEPSLAGAGDAPEAPRFEGEEVFRKLLAPLPEKLRVAVVLREQAGLTYDEMAKVLGCTLGAVEQRLHRALVQLREIWKGERDSFLK